MGRRRTWVAEQYSECMGFRYIHVFDHVNKKLSVLFLDDIFIIF